MTSSAYLSLLSILEIPSSRENYEGKRELRIPGIIRVIATLYVYISLSLSLSRYRSLRPYAFRDTRRQVSSLDERRFDFCFFRIITDEKICLFVVRVGEKEDLVFPGLTLPIHARCFVSADYSRCESATTTLVFFVFFCATSRERKHPESLSFILSLARRESRRIRREFN